MALRTYRVTCRDIDGVEHTVGASAESLYEAIARGLDAFRSTYWAGEIGHGQTTITVVVKQPEIEHKVQMRDFEVWLERSLTGSDGFEVAFAPASRRVAISATSSSFYPAETCCNMSIEV